MKKNLAFFALLIVGLINLLSLDISAQEKVAENKLLAKPCSNNFKLPQSVGVDNDALQNFVKISSLPSGQRAKTFSSLPKEAKADVFKLQLALQFIKRPDLSQEQKDLILETISKTSADSYERTTPEQKAKAEQEDAQLQEKALAIFPPNDAYTIFASLNSNEKDVERLQKYDSAISHLTMGESRRFFRELSPSEKSSLWKSQMVYYLATSKLNKAQQNLFLDVITLSTPQAFSSPAGKNATNDEAKALDALEAKAFELFSKDELWLFFMSFGSHKTLLNKTLSQSNVSESRSPTKTFTKATLNKPSKQGKKLVVADCDCN